jgi:two-component system, NtrC family, sensor kinase
VARELADQLEAHVDAVVRINEQLNAMLERRSTSVLERTQASRQRVLVTILGCFGLAILAALTLGFMLTRSILRPLAELREGVLRLAQGDLTTRIQLSGKDEFSELAKRFNQMAADLTCHQDDLVRSHKLASIGQIAAGVAHEINNPLAVILGYVKLMLKESTEPKACDLHVIEDEARQCQRIVQGLLDLARPMQLDITRIDLADIVCDAVERLKGSGKLDALEIQQIPQDIHLTAYGDETKIRQVVFNIILNAAEAMPSGGHLGIQMELENEAARLSVTDTGPGIPADVLPYVFDPFFTTKPRGAGLGLVTSQAIVDAHGGSIDIQSRPGKGTSVILRLPLEPRTTGDGAPPVAALSKPKERSR